MSVFRLFLSTAWTNPVQTNKGFSWLTGNSTPYSHQKLACLVLQVCEFVHFIWRFEKKEGRTPAGETEFKQQNAWCVSNRSKKCIRCSNCSNYSLYLLLSNSGLNKPLNSLLGLVFVWFFTGITLILVRVISAVLLLSPSPFIQRSVSTELPQGIWSLEKHQATEA